MVWYDYGVQGGTPALSVIRQGSPCLVGRAIVFGQLELDLAAEGRRASFPFHRFALLCLLEE